MVTAFTLTAGANNYTDIDAIYWGDGYSYSWTEAARLKTDRFYGYQKCILQLFHIILGFMVRG